MALNNKSLDDCLKRFEERTVYLEKVRNGHVAFPRTEITCSGLNTEDVNKLKKLRFKVVKEENLSTTFEISR